METAFPRRKLKSLLLYAGFHLSAASIVEGLLFRHGKRMGSQRAVSGACRKPGGAEG